MAEEGGEAWSSVWLQPNTRAKANERRQQESQAGPREDSAGTAGFLGLTSLGRDGGVGPALEKAAAKKVSSMNTSAGLTESQTVPESL